MFKVFSELKNSETLMRDAYCNTLMDMAKTDKRIVALDADLVSSSGMKPFFKAFPDRAIQCGIAEANMIGVAAGLSLTGKVPFCHSFGPFASRRVCDQIFISAAYARLNVRIVGSDPGVTAAMNGGTHMPFEDVALYRVIPGSTVLEPSDPTCLKSLLKQAVDQPGIKYIRVGRKSMARIYEDGSEMTIGVAPVLRDGTDVVIFAAGIMVHEALQAALSLEKQGISAAVVDCYSIKPLDTDTVTAMAIKTGAVVVAENANRHGGLYSAVLEVLAENCPVPAACVAVEDEFGEVGSQSYLQQRFGLTAAHIEEQVKAVIARK